MSTPRVERIKQGLAIGSVGALSAFVVESVIRRVPAVAVCPIRRAIARVLLGGVGAALADSAHAPDVVSSGILAGPVLTSALDLGGRYMGGRRAVAMASGGGAPTMTLPVEVQMDGVPTVESSIDAAIATLDGDAPVPARSGS